MTTNKESDSTQPDWIKLIKEIHFDIENRERTKFKMIYKDGLIHPRDLYIFDTPPVMSESEILEAFFIVLRDALMKVCDGVDKCVQPLLNNKNIESEEYIKDCVEFNTKATRLLIDINKAPSLANKKEFNIKAREFIMSAKDKFFIGNEEHFHKFVADFYRVPI